MTKIGENFSEKAKGDYELIIKKTIALTRN